MSQASEREERRTRRPSARSLPRPPTEEQRGQRLAEHVGEVAEGVRVERPGQELEQQDGQAGPGGPARRQQPEQPERGGEPRRRRAGPHQDHGVDPEAQQRNEQNVEGNSVREAKGTGVLGQAGEEPLAAGHAGEVVGVEHLVADHHQRRRAGHDLDQEGGHEGGEGPRAGARHAPLPPPGEAQRTRGSGRDEAGQQGRIGRAREALRPEQEGLGERRLGGGGEGRGRRQPRPESRGSHEHRRDREEQRQSRGRASPRGRMQGRRIE